MTESVSKLLRRAISIATLRATLLILLGCIFLTLPMLHAQETATIAGTVTDQSGAVVSDAKVTLVNQATRFTRVVETNAKGQYVASAIPTGSYAITALKTGFKELRRSDVQLTVASTLTVDLQLSVGAVTSTVSVSGTAPLLQTQSAAVSGLVDSRQMLALPLVSRDFTDLVLLTPGAHIGTAANLGAGAGGYSMRGGDNFSVNGSIAAGNTYMVNGIFDRMLWLNTLVIVPMVDSIQEYRVMTSNYSAEYGDAAGALTTVATKSGSNALHGDAWEFLRNTDLNANDYFNNLNHIPRPSFHRNQFGFTLGGPILHNKTFFFVDYEHTHASQPKTSTNTIPTPAQVQMVETGNFSAFGTTIYNPYSTTTVGTTTVRNAFPGNQIPTILLDPAAVKIIKLLPTPTNSAAVNNYVYNAPRTQETNQFDVRIDQNLRASDRLFVYYDYDKSDFVSPGIIPSPANSPVPIGPYLSAGGDGGTAEPLFNQDATVGYTKVIGSKMVSQSHVGLVRWNARITPLGIKYNTATALGIPGMNFNQQSGGMPAFTVSGLTEIGDNSTFPEDSAQTSLQGDTALTVILGSHNLQLGIVALRHWFNGFSGFPTRGTFDFNGQYTSQINIPSSKTALADFALGTMDSGSRNYLDGSFAMRLWQLSPYIQDTWRVTDRLTVDAGLRWDIDAPVYEKHNHWANLDLTTGLLRLAGVNGNNRRLVNFDLNTPGPRVGLIYALTSDRKTILRAGGGLSYVFENAGGSQLYKNLPYFTAQNIVTSTNSAPTQTLSQGLPIPVAPIGETEAQLSTGSPTAWDVHLKHDQIASWSLGVQRQLTRTIMVDVSYVGTRGNRLLINPNPNQAAPGPGAVGPRRPYYKINPNLVNISLRTGAGGSKYESLQVHAEQRFSRGLTFGVSYTYSSYLSDAGNPNGGGNSNYQNDQCIPCNWGPTPDDNTHVLSVNHVYELPFGAQRNYLNHGVLSYILGGWNLNGIWSFQSGSRYNPTLSTNVSNQAGGGTQRPNRIGSGNLPSGQRNISHWFNTADFVAPPQYTFGNTGTGILTGPDYFNVDLALIRSFALPKGTHLTIRSEWFNAFNRANFGTPNASIGTAQAGTISSDVVGPGGTSARVIQMAAKLEF